MSFETALRLTELLLGFAILQQSLEHFVSPWELRIVFGLRACLGLLLMSGVAAGLTALALVGISLLILSRFNGPYNGGSDRMSLLILLCMCAAHLLPGAKWQEVAFAYLAIQLILSYVLSGAVKIVNPDWRNGVALRNVFLFSVYPVSEELRGLANWPRLLFVMSWCVMLFELLFPVALLSPATLIFALGIAAMFHLANACLFGLNRFFWAWLAAYPSIIWFQQRFTDFGGL